MPESSYPQRIAITEVGPRDGLQMESEFIPTATKIAPVNELVDAGVRHFEVTSFVSPRAIPQLRDAAEVLPRCSLASNGGLASRWACSRPSVKALNGHWPPGSMKSWCFCRPPKATTVRT